MWLAAAVVFLFGFVVAFGAPYLPTQKKQIATSLELAQLKKGDTLVDLGSGDGAVLIFAAKRGIRGVGYEINPILWLVSSLRALLYRKLVTIKFKSYWSDKLPECDAVFVFLIGHQMKRLDDKLSVELKPGSRLVSHAFQVPGKKHITKKDGVFLYEY